MLNFKKDRINKKKLLGKGSFGVVRPYQKNDQDEKWAAKIILNFSLEDFLNTFREIVLGFSCDHPNVLPARGYMINYNKETEESEICIKLPRTQVDSLKEVLRKSRESQLEVSELQIAQYFYELVSGLQYLHRRGIAHRDIKPANILFDKKEGTIRIADFGIGDLQEEGGTTYALAEKAGDPIYAAPENLDMKRKNIPKRELFRTDIWSLGMVLFELCTQMEPDDIKKLITSSAKERLEENLKEHLQRLKEKKRYSERLIDLVASLLRVNSEERRSLEDIKQELVNIFGANLRYNKSGQEEPSVAKQDMKETLEELQKELAAKDAHIFQIGKQSEDIIVELKKELAESQNQLSANRIVQNELQDSVQGFKARIQVIQEELTKKDTYIIELEKNSQKTIDELKKQLEESQMNQKQLEVRSARAVEEAIQYKGFIENLQKKLDEAEAHNNLSIKELDGLKKQIEESQMNQKQMEVRSSRAVEEVIQYKGAIENLQKKLDEAEAHNNLSIKELDRLKKQLEESQRIQKQMEVRSARAVEEAAQYKEAYKNQKKLDETQNHSQMAQEELVKLEQELKSRLQEKQNELTPRDKGNYFIDNMKNIQIFVKSPAGKTLALECSPLETVQSIKTKIYDKEAIPSDQQTLFFNYKELKDKVTLFEYNIQREATIHLKIHSCTVDNLIYVKSRIGETLIFKHSQSEFVSSLKDKIHNQEGIRPDQQVLIFAGRILENNRTLSEENVPGGSIIHLFERSN